MAMPKPFVMFWPFLINLVKGASGRFSKSHDNPVHISIPSARYILTSLPSIGISCLPALQRSDFHSNRHSPDDSETSMDSSDFAASLGARREVWMATSRSGSPNDGRGVDLTIFPGTWTHSSCRLRLNA